MDCETLNSSVDKDETVIAQILNKDKWRYYGKVLKSTK